MEKNRRDNHGVDNNRNYSYVDNNGNEVWNTSGTSSSPNGSTYAGDEPFSEAENRAVRHLVESKNFKLALNNHTYGNLLLYPMDMIIINQLMMMKSINLFRLSL